MLVDVLNQSASEADDAHVMLWLSRCGCRWTQRDPSLLIHALSLSSSGAPGNMMPVIGHLILVHSMLLWRAAVACGENMGVVKVCARLA